MDELIFGTRLALICPAFTPRDVAALFFSRMEIQSASREKENHPPSNYIPNWKDDNLQKPGGTNFLFFFSLPIVYSQSQTSQTDNGGGLRGGAAGDEGQLNTVTDVLDCVERWLFCVLIVKVWIMFLHLMSIMPEGSECEDFISNVVTCTLRVNDEQLYIMYVSVLMHWLKSQKSRMSVLKKYGNNDF